MSIYNAVFDGKEEETFTCSECGSLALIDEKGRLMRMIFNVQGLPVVYEEEDKDSFIASDGSLKCDCK